MYYFNNVTHDILEIIVSKLNFKDLNNLANSFDIIKHIDYSIVLYNNYELKSIDLNEIFDLLKINDVNYTRYYSILSMYQLVNTVNILNEDSIQRNSTLIYDIRKLYLADTFDLSKKVNTNGYLLSKKLDYVLDSISILSNLKKLYLNCVHNVPLNFVFKLVNLTTLSLTYSGLLSIPADIENLINLKILRMNCNSLSILPKEINKLTNLEELTIGYNKFENFPNISELINLRKLNIQTNYELTIIPDYITNLKDLRTLDIYNTKVQHLPDFSNHPLQYLNLGIDLYEKLSNVLKTKKGLTINHHCYRYH